MGLYVALYADGVILELFGTFENCAFALLS
jgi:hypothetical protein